MKYKYISRVDSGHTHCWYFRFAQREHWPINHNKTFSDGIYGSKAKSLKAAITYRDNYLKACKKLHLLNNNGTCIRHRHASNTSGIIGVHFQINYKKHNEYHFWAASGQVDYKHWRKTFSTNKYEDEQAFHMACEARFKRHGTLAIVAPIRQLPYRPLVPYKRHTIFANSRVT